MQAQAFSSIFKFERWTDFFNAHVPTPERGTACRCVTPYWSLFRFACELERDIPAFLSAHLAGDCRRYLRAALETGCPLVAPFVADLAKLFEDGVYPNSDDEMGRFLDSRLEWLSEQDGNVHLFPELEAKRGPLLAALEEFVQSKMLAHPRPFLECVEVNPALFANKKLKRFLKSSASR